jgi:hypothetical protein
MAGDPAVRLERIVVGLDGSDDAAGACTFAAGLAARLGAAVVGAAAVRSARSVRCSDRFEVSALRDTTFRGRDAAWAAAHVVRFSVFAEKGVTVAVSSS